MTKKQTTTSIEKGVQEQYLLDKYKAVCEAVEDYRLQVEYLESEQGQQIAGKEGAKDQLVKVRSALMYRETEKEFLAVKINGILAENGKVEDVDEK